MSRPFLAAMTAILAAAGVAPGPAGAEEDGARFVMPIPDAERGRDLFVSKGCFVCHSVNGVGGAAGPTLDTGPAAEPVDPLEFSARMWRGALAMVELQSAEFGYQIDLTGRDIADLAAFAADPALQATFTEEMIPEVIREWMIEEPFEPTPLDDNYKGEE